METTNLPVLKDRFGEVIRSGDFIKLLVTKGRYSKESLFKVVFSPAQHRWGLSFLRDEDTHDYEEVFDCSFYLTPNLAKYLKVISTNYVK